MKVIKQFVDKYTKELVTVGTVLKDVTEERKKELIEAGVVEAPKPAAKKTAEKK